MLINTGVSGVINVSRMLTETGQKRMPRVVSITSLERIQDAPIGWTEDAPRKPLPLDVVMANMKRLNEDPTTEPTLRAKAGEFKKHEYYEMLAAYEVWSLRS